MNGRRIVILIPTYNEKENIRLIVPRVVAEAPDAEIWVIDDSSPDGTAAVVRELAASYPQVFLVVREKKNGLGEAYKHALRIIQKMPDVHAVVTMDADGSHDPAKVPELLAALAGHDLAIGSRYVRGGGGMADAGLYRSLLSQGGNLYARIIVGHGIKDSTAGFVAFRRSTLDGVDLDSISSTGYAYQIDFKDKLLEHGRTFVEVPISFPDRQIGASKMSGSIVREGIVAPWGIAYRRLKDRSRFFKVALSGLAIALFVFAAFAATYKISESPSVWYDEGIYIQLASNMASHGMSGLRISPAEIVRVPELTVGYPLTAPLALVLKLFGDGIVQARLLMALFIMAFIAASYALVRRLYGQVPALWALALLVSFAPLYGNGKSVLGEVPGMLFVVLSLLSLELSKTAYSPRLWSVLAGLSAGLAAATKPFFLILPAALAIGLFFGRKEHRLSWKDIAAGAAAFLVPIVLWLWLQFGGGISPAELLSHYANPYQYGSIWTVIAGNIKGLFTGAGPLYLLVMLAVWLGAVWVRARRGLRTGTPEMAALAFSLITLAAFLRTSGMYRYIFPAQAISILFFAPALAACASALPWRRVGPFAARWAAPAIVIALAVVGIYQIEFDSWIADSYDATKTAGWELHFSALAPSAEVFFYDAPEVAIFDTGGSYYQYLTPGPGLAVGERSLAALASGTPDEVIAVTDKLGNIDKKLLAGYPRESRFYKYSILRKR